MKGRGFRCGSDEKVIRMWFGLEIDVVGLPPLVKHNLRFNKFCQKNISFFRGYIFCNGGRQLYQYNEDGVRFKFYSY